MKSGTEKFLSRLHKEFDIPEEKSTEEEDDYERRYRAARARRVEEAGYIDNYVRLFNRDYWTDEWLGPGPDPGYQYMEPASKKTKVSDKEIEQKDWLQKFSRRKMPNVTISSSEPKAVKRARKERKKYEDSVLRQKKYDLVYWFMESYLKPDFAKSIYAEYANRFDEMVDDMYEYATNWLDYVNHYTDEDLTIDDVMFNVEDRYSDEKEVIVDVGGMKFKRLESAERKRRHYETDWTVDSCPDIPDEYWAEFKKWCKDQPLKKYEKKAKKLGLGKSVGAIGLRRIAFLEKINKRNKGFHKNIMKSGINLFDPATGQSFISEKKMKEYVHKRMKKYDEQRAKFIDLLDGMVKRGEISEDMAIGWMDDTKEARERIHERYKAMSKRITDGRKKHGKPKFDHEHEKRYHKERDAWFKKFGADPNDQAFTISFDGERNNVTNIAKRGKPPIWRVDRPGGTDFIEL